MQSRRGEFGLRPAGASQLRQEQCGAGRLMLWMRNHWKPDIGQMALAATVLAIALLVAIFLVVVG